ncbi:hypothetical protein SBY92_004261 [Candida maltosa Xu316]|uniref:Cruciform cutting endonuclease, putative n=1 Tax=Candida maltosa (strain Xu316) TaxID=1245528 RepID=M3K2I7_CANMX|nr:Cruciform cutting endonuclease, putative [Candida maltosa Xu316]
MVDQQLVKKLTSYTNPVLNELAIICGCPVLSTTKANRISGILAGYNFYLKNYHEKQPRKTLSIDIGIRNFSYCKTIASPNTFPLTVTKWDKFDLFDRYGAGYEYLLHESSVVDERYQLNYIVNQLMNELKPSDFDVVVLETQRTRSVSNSATLPNVLKNFTLENLIIGHTYPQIVIPMSSSSMLNFWIGRYIQSSKTKKSKSPKRVRFDLIKSWRGKMFELPGYPSGELKKKEFMEYLNLKERNKIDDLVDSLLYNLTINSYFNNLKEFHELVQYDDCDLIEFVNSKRAIQLEFIEPLIEKYELEIKDSWMKS